MLAVLLAATAMSATVAANAHSVNRVVEAYDCEVIVEVDRSLETLTSEGVKNVQEALQNRIAQYVTPHFDVLDSFGALVNAFSLRINSKHIDSIKKVPGVKSVTKNEIHWVSSVYNPDDGYYPLGEGDEEVGPYGGATNVSAVTMNKPGSDEEHPGTTNEGEGTVIAVLDNEFYFRAEHKELNQAGEEVTIPGWYHETYGDLASTVVKRFDFKTTGTEEEIAESKARYLEWVKGTHAATKHKQYGEGADGLVDYDADPDKAQKVIETPLGKEGSLYFNSKIPFYFDYGGEKKVHSDYASHDFDVSSETSYHGSHVSSTAAGNASAETGTGYKGIAPNAQLVCMKVFTEYTPTEVEEKVGLTAGSYGYDLPILRALEDCILLGVDGINMSLGNNLNDFDKDSITCRILTKLAKGELEASTGKYKHQPIMTSISAGNDGKSSYDFVGGYGNWTFDMAETGTHSGYSNLDDVTTIAAGQPVRKFYTKAFQMGDNYIEYEDQVVNREGVADDYETEHELAKDLASKPGFPTLEWVFVPGFGGPDSYDKLAARDISVNGRIAVIKRGDISFAEKYKNAYNIGHAAAVIIINNDPTASSFNMRMDFGGDEPAIPVVMVLYSDMKLFGPEYSTGTFNVISDQIGDNVKKYTRSDFSSDGGTYDLRLKPDITAPGENIRGAVPPQKKEDREHPLSTYEFLSGTSMSAPNYAGAQSVMLSSKAKSVYASGEPSEEALQELYAYRKTIDMRLMSTADPMYDYDPDPETLRNTESEVRQLTSPRIQGAGMVNLGDALKTDVYLEGLDLQGNGIGKSKIQLRNNLDINQGDINLSFLAHNENASASRTYDVSVTLLRPAVEHNSDVLTKEYKEMGEVTDISLFPGKTYWDYKWEGDPGSAEFIPAAEFKCDLSFAAKEAYKVPRDIYYWKTEADCIADHPSEDPDTWTTTHQSVIKAGKYVNLGDDLVAVWEPAPEFAYQSTQDTLLATFDDFDQITVAAGETKSVSLKTQSLTALQKEAIAQFFEYGCYLEGYVTLTPTDNTLPTLSMPWMGFYGGVDKEGNTLDYSSAPVVEPFSFEKDPNKIYPSDLVNDLGRQLVNLNTVDMGSEWITTYIEPGKSFDENEILENKNSLSNLAATDDAYRLVGTDLDGQRYEHPEQNIYVGSPETSNTMIIQQFVLRSVKDNYFEIKNSQGEVVLRDALQDMLYGSDLHSWPLYKSHVDAGFIGGGYLAHRAWGVISLFDDCGEPFPSGEYTIEFNYELASTGETITNTYHMIIDSDAPSFINVKEQGENLVINIAEKNVAEIVIGSNTVDLTNTIDPEYPPEYVMTYAETDTGCSVTLKKTDAILIMNESLNKYDRTGRLFIGVTDKAYGKTGTIVKFKKLKRKAAIKKYGEEFVNSVAYIPNLGNYTVAERSDFTSSNDLSDNGQTISFFYLDNKGNPTEIYLSGYTRIVRFPNNKSTTTSTSGCGGNVVATSTILSALAGALAISLIIVKTKKKKGGLQ